METKTNGVCYNGITENSFSCDVTENVPQTFVTRRSYRPRGSLARTLYEKQHHDHYLSNLDRMQVGSDAFYLFFKVSNLHNYYQTYNRMVKLEYYMRMQTQLRTIFFTCCVHQSSAPITQ